MKMKMPLGQHIQFYRKPEVVAAYEEGRSKRLFVSELWRVLAANRGSKAKVIIPLYSIFDWLYNERLTRLTIDVLDGPILDIGCGTSYVFRSMIARGWRGYVAGIDISGPMIDEGTRQIQRMIEYTPQKAQQRDGLYIYRDALGREVVDVTPTATAPDNASLNFLLNNRKVEDLHKSDDKSFYTVTAFSGPFCFYPLKKQAELFREALGRAERHVSLQFKNAAFNQMNTSPDLIKRIAGVITHILKNDIADSYSFLTSIDFGSSLLLPPFHQDVSVSHEVGAFSYYLTPIQEVRCWLEENGFKLLATGTMGFASETYFNLLNEFYSLIQNDPGRLERFIRAVEGIDRYFCEQALLGDNLHITATREQSLAIPPVEYSFTETYRSNYAATVS